MHDDPDIGLAMDVRLRLRVATLGSRALAQVIDAVLLQVVHAFVLCCGGAGAIGLAGATNVSPGWALALVVLVTTLVVFGWFAIYEIGWQGQTPGKRWVGLRVVTDDGRVPDAGAIVLRNALRLVDFLPGGYLVGVITMILSPHGKRLGDLVAGTLVIVDEKAPEPTRRWPEGLPDAEVRLLEAYFARVATLEPAVRETLALRLLERLDRQPLPGVSAAVTLATLCPAAE